MRAFFSTGIPPRWTIAAALIALAFALILVLWSVFGSYQIQEVVGQSCGLEQVFPCVQVSITREVDLLDRHRPYAISAASTLVVVCAVILALTLRRRD